MFKWKCPSAHQLIYKYILTYKYCIFCIMKSQSYALNIAEQQCVCPRLALVKTFLLLIKTKIFSRLPKYGSAQFSANNPVQLRTRLYERIIYGH